MKKAKSNARIEIRLTRGNKSRIKTLAKLYAGGNVSAWVTYAALNAERKILKCKTG